jgi:hypothetical protein
LASSIPALIKRRSMRNTAMTDEDVTAFAVPDKPGIYPGIPFADYLAIKAASASTIATLLTSFPARLKYPSLDTPAKTDGRIAHELVLEGRSVYGSEQYQVVPSGFSMSHVKKYGELIEHIIETGKKPISEDRAATIEAMAEALKADPQVRRVFSKGRPEVTALWHDPETGVLCKARFDWWPESGQIFPDYKTTVSVDDDALSKAANAYGLAHRSAWYEDAARIAGGRDDEARPPIYLPVWQEKSPPYFVVMRPVNGHHVKLVRPEIRRALRLYAECLEKDEWPGPKNFEPLDLPGWRVNQLEWAAKSGEEVESDDE